MSGDTDHRGESLEPPYWSDAKEFIASFGRVWEKPEQRDEGEALTAEPLSGALLELEGKLLDGQSVLLSGEPGVGKTTLMRSLGRKLFAKKWLVFEAGAADVLSGRTYIGQLEERVQGLARWAETVRVLWILENFDDLLWAGRHHFSQGGLLDLLLPLLMNRAIVLIGECRPHAYEALLQLRPKLRSALAVHRMAPAGEKETLELAEFWAKRRRPGDGGALLSAALLREAYHLVKQYLSDRAPPGNLLDFLKLAHQRLTEAKRPAGAALSQDDLIEALSYLTGLPRSILDDRIRLDLKELKDFFHQRVLGQPEAVECLVERIAMIKAALTDPTRPLGVFLFVGPTGTGKTEIAKALAQFLFGAPDRMIRLDMSEFQSFESMDRILGDPREPALGTALVDAIRKQPFSVILLDEFEKAHPRIWDVFLQLFDDGRLTDRNGRTADFRHSIVIMTSNLGSAVPQAAGIGFGQGKTPFDPAGVERAVAQVFRPEFTNRIDRIVIFRPLTRGVMRELLRKEFDEIVQRRGLRTRPWAVEWEESAMEFLIERGFSPDLGARPLKRAIERHVIAPLAVAIVNREVPEGDQFLFIKSDGEKIEAAFVDPDKPEGASHLPSGTAPQRLEDLILEAAGAPQEVDFLKSEHERLSAQVRADGWQKKKAAALERIGGAGFWEAPDRFRVLGLAEFMDRLDAGLETAGSLLGRLAGPRRALARAFFPRDLVRQLASQLYLLRAALAGFAEERPRDAFLSVGAIRDAGIDKASADDFARRLGSMYKQWAKARRMRSDILEEKIGLDGAPYRLVLAVSGFGAYGFLAPESGLHVLEAPQESGGLRRLRARVCVAPQPEEPVGPEDGGLARQAAEALERVPSQLIVRRYRKSPSPLVRDSVRKWRTGKLEQVLAGNFDLIS